MRKKILTVLMLGLSLSYGGQMNPIGLQELLLEAESIFLAKVISHKFVAGTHETKPGWLTQFEVLKTYKGQAREYRSIKQFSPKLGSQAHEFIETPHFVAQEVVLVFLGGESRLGYVSPIGLSQGVLRPKSKVKSLKDAQRAIFRNKYQNRYFAHGLTHTRLQKAMMQTQELSADQFRLADLERSLTWVKP